jgi:hypothetical protein
MSLDSVTMMTSSSNVELGRTLGTLLRGKIDGKQHFGLLCAALSGTKPGGVVFLDFSDVEDLSASWVAAALPPLLTWAATPETELYPVLVGVLGNEKKWEDEFELVANRAGINFLAALPATTAQGRVLGDLDPILMKTLQAVQTHREVTGAGLKRLHPNEGIGATAWSNRLKDLHTKRLLRRATHGREQLYTPVMEVTFDGPAGAGVAGR